jgi:hypothetical protein
MDEQTILPAYQCHKTVHAGKITAIDGDELTLGELNLAWKVSPAWMTKHNPQVGGYLVVYADGYESYSPAKAFEEGYTKKEIS